MEGGMTKTNEDIRSDMLRDVKGDVMKYKRRDVGRDVKRFSGEELVGMMLDWLWPEEACGVVGLDAGRGAGEECWWWWTAKIFVFHSQLCHT